MATRMVVAGGLKRQSAAAEGGTREPEQRGLDRHYPVPAIQAIMLRLQTFCVAAISVKAQSLCSGFRCGSKRASQSCNYTRTSDRLVYFTDYRVAIATRDDPAAHKSPCKVAKP